MDTAGNIKRHICYGQNGREPLEVFKLAILAAPKLRPGSYDYRAIHGVYHSQVYPASKSHKMLQDWTERRFTRFRGRLRNQSDPMGWLVEIQFVAAGDYLAYPINGRRCKGEASKANAYQLGVASGGAAGRAAQSTKSRPIRFHTKERPTDNEHPDRVRKSAPGSKAGSFHTTRSPANDHWSMDGSRNFPRLRDDGEWAQAVYVHDRYLNFTDKQLVDAFRSVMVSPEERRMAPTWPHRKVVETADAASY